MSGLFALSMNGVHYLSKRLTGTETTAMLFLMMNNGVPHPRQTTTEPGEHVFGSLRTQKREFSVKEANEMVDKLRRKHKAMAHSSLQPHRDPQKGYNSTANDFQQDSLKSNITYLTGGPCCVDYTSDVPLVHQIWPTLPVILNLISKHLKQSLNCFAGVLESELPSLANEVLDIDDFIQNFGSLLPRKFEQKSKNNVSNVTEIEENCDKSVESNNEKDDMLDDEVTKFDSTVLYAGDVVKKDAKESHLNRMAKNLLTSSQLEDEDSEQTEEAINVDDVSEGSDTSNSDDNTVDETAANETTLGVKVLDSMTDIMRALASKGNNISDIQQKLLKGMSIISLGKLDRDTTSDCQHAKSLNQRYMGGKKLNDVDLPAENTVAVGQTVILKSDTDMIYKVMCIYEKYYNKWYVSPKGIGIFADEKGSPTAKGKYRLLLHLLKTDISLSILNYRKYSNAEVGDIVDNKTLKLGDIVVLKDCVEISVMNIEAV